MKKFIIIFLFEEILIVLTDIIYKGVRDMKRKTVPAIIAVSVITLAACSTSSDANNSGLLNTKADSVSFESGSSPQNNSSGSVSVTMIEGIDTDDMFSERDLDQSPDLSDATYITATSGQDFIIDHEGIYVLSGNATDATVIIDAGDEDKVQLVLDDLIITNSDSPAIYVKNSDKVFVTTDSGESTLKVLGDFSSDEDTGLDAVIFSKDDLVLNGTGTLNIISSDNGVSCKDTLKFTGGTVNIDCEGSALESNDAIEIADGTINITGCNEGLHADDNDDDTKGYIYIGGGNITINAADDAVHAITNIVIDDAEINIKAAEGIEATVIQINGGNITIDASDDGINAARKSSSYSPLFELNGGYVKITMGQGDTDGVDSNGDIIINAGTIDITGQSTFDYDGTAKFGGGTIIENGKETNNITGQSFGAQGGMGGQGRMGENGPMNGQRGPAEFDQDMPGDFDPDNMPEVFDQEQSGFERPDNTQRPDGMERPGGMGRPGEN